MRKLRKITFHRFVLSKNLLAPVHLIVFRDESGKWTVAKYKLASIKSKGKFLYRLDGRSVRYMKRKEIIEDVIGSRRLNTPYEVEAVDE